MILGSLAIHAIAFAVVRMEWKMWVPPVRSSSTLEQPRVEVVEVVPEPIDVILVVDAPVANAPHVAHSRGIAGLRRTTRSDAVNPTDARGTPDMPAATQHLSMRGPELHPDDAQLAHIAEAPGHAPPSALIPSKRLVPSPGGRFHIDDEVTTITIDRDGTAHLHDKPDFSINFALNPVKLWHAIKDAGSELADEARAPAPEEQRPESTVFAQGIRAVCDQYQRELCDDSGNGKQPELGGGLLGGKFDETSYLMRKLGVGDAYASRKLAVLDATRLERAERGATYKQAQLDRSSQQMLANLGQVWRVTRSPRDRKAAVFELWDECAEGEGSIAEAGERARKIVIAWIRVKLPPGSPGAFTSEELATLDQRRSSHHPFAPYAE